MSLSVGEITRVLEELRPRCEGALVGKIRLRNERDLTMELRAGRRRHTLLLSTHPRAGRLHFIAPPKGSGEAPGGFVQLLRARIEGARLRTMTQPGEDRVVELSFERRDEDATEKYSLIAELLGPRANLHLLDAERQVVGSLHAHRNKRAGIGTQWQAPAGMPPPKPPRQFEGSGDYAERVAAFYEKELGRLEDAERRAALARALGAERKHLRRLVENLESDLSRADEGALWREMGELLKTYAKDVPAEATKAALPRFDASRGMLEIALDPALKAGENADRYFARARKATRTREEASKRREEALVRLEKIEAFLAEAKQGPLDPLEKRAVALGVSLGKKQKPQAVSPDGRTQRRALEKLGIRPRLFVSETGTEIYVGRNDRENDLLTTRFARPHDYFFHVAGAPGSHVIACVEKNGRLDDATRWRAAELALEYSSLGKSRRGEVGYAQRRYVRKRKGDPPGAVHVVGPQKTLWVELS